MAQGIVKFFNPAKGFGFITPQDGGKDIFVPAASITQSGVANLKTGQTVSFETEPDAKGPKAVKLAVIAEAPEPTERPAPRPAPPPTSAPTPQPREREAERITLYHDPSSEESEIVLEVLAEAGCAPRLVDYVAAPPSRETLKHLSLLVGANGQSLARKYDPLFLELRLDDRFISDSEFWSAIVEHPTLINGPVLADGSKARVCRTEEAVKLFLGQGVERPAKPKGLPPSLARAANGAASMVVAEAPVTEARTVEKPVLEKPVMEKPVAAKPAIEKTVTENPAPEKAELAPQKTKPAAPIKAKPEAKATPTVKAQTKIKTKAKAVAAKPAAKPAKKPARTKK